MKAYLLAAAAATLALAGPAAADVKAGVDAWARGDFKAAVEQWRPAAVAGDPDAQFNLGQAYKLGRGVPVDPALAQSWFRKAATQGHAQAEDNLGLALFQDGRKDEALPWLEKSVARDERRTELVLGTMLFNGDGVAKDWTRAYALVTRSSQQGLNQAGPTLAQMDQYIPDEQRQKGIALAQQYERMAKQAPPAAPRPTVDPGAPPAQYGARSPDAPRLAADEVSGRLDPAPSRADTTPPAGAKTPPPPGRPARNGRDALTGPDGKPLAPAPRSTPTARPAPAAAPKTTTVAKAPPPPKPAPAPKPATAARPAPAPKPVTVAKSPPRPAPSGGSWRIQLGAFRDEGNAKALWGRVGARTGGSPAYVKGGGVVRLQATGFASRADAQRACTKAGGACMVVAP